MLTPETIASRRFDKQVGGYKQDEVEMFLQQVAGEYAKLLSEKEDLEEKIEVLAEKVEQYREDEDSLRSALIGAQKLGDSVIRESKSKAEYILREAQAQADQILENAQKSIEKEQMALIKMQKEVTKFKNRLLTLYRQHLEMISALPEYDDEPAREPAAEQNSRSRKRRNRQNHSRRSQPAKSSRGITGRLHRKRPSRTTFNEEPLIDFSSALGDEMQETTSFAPIGRRYRICRLRQPERQHRQYPLPSGRRAILRLELHRRSPSLARLNLVKDLMWNGTALPRAEDCFPERSIVKFFCMMR